jgi:hypothetical protein
VAPFPFVTSLSALPGAESTEGGGKHGPQAQDRRPGVGHRWPCVTCSGEVSPSDHSPRIRVGP